MKALLMPLLTYQVAIKWYLYAFGFWISIKLTAALLHYFITGIWPAFGSESIIIIIIVIFTSALILTGEEIGWRGYALPRLAGHMGYVRASLVLGILGACWHLPLFYFPGHGNYGQSFPVYFLIVIALSYAITWLYLNTRRSLLLVTLMHSAYNQTTGIVPTRFSEPGNPMTIDTSLITMLTLLILLSITIYLVFRIQEKNKKESELL